MHSLNAAKKVILPAILITWLSQAVQPNLTHTFCPIILARLMQTPKKHPSTIQSVSIQLADRFRVAIAHALGNHHASVDPQLRLANNPKFGDYQANLAMGLAKKLGQKPRDIAQRIVTSLDVDDICNKVEIAGPGFINLHLSKTFVYKQIAAMAADPDRVRNVSNDPMQTVVVDYSGPNVAKEMHVGHLRSTVIGDCIARVLEFQGHNVIRQNHLGDWGTQFGMLIRHLDEIAVAKDGGKNQGQNLNELYQEAKQRFDTDPDFANRARKQVVALQAGESDALDQWRSLVEQSKSHFQQVYERLDVSLTDLDYRGESFYNPQLPEIIDELEKTGQLKNSQGAKVLYPKGFKDRDGNPQPMIVQKSDGGYLYATTDLAAARYRITNLHADRIIYVTDARQNQHFAMVFTSLRQAEWASSSVRLDHVPFGTVLGKDGKPFKTRQGGTVKLIDLIDEAERRAGDVIRHKSPDMPNEQQRQIAHTIGIGALKYADLANDRIKDYVFDWDRMLCFDGNTSPYLQNAYVRIQAIFRKGGLATHDVSNHEILIHDPAERWLAIKLLQLPETINAVAESLEPHRLCTYLYDLASAFHQFYEKCPVLNADHQTSRTSRLALCNLVGKTLATGLDLLGIRVVERM